MKPKPKFHRASTMVRRSNAPSLSLFEKAEKTMGSPLAKRQSVYTLMEGKISKLIEEYQKNRNNPNKRTTVSFFREEGTTYVIPYILSKTYRSQNDLLILKGYLKTLERFASVLQSGVVDIDPLLMNIAMQIKCEKMKSGNIIFKYGERGNKFYVIMKGTVSILIPKENKIKLTLIDYVIFLMRLVICKEKEMLSRTITANKTLYNLTEKDVEIFTHQIVKKLKKASKEDEEEDGIDMLSSGGEENTSKEKIENSLSNVLSPEKDKKSASPRKKNKEEKQEKINPLSLLNKFEPIEMQQIYQKVSLILAEYQLFVKKSRKNQATIFDYTNMEYPSAKLQAVPSEQELTLFSYFEVVKLSKGDFFGELALQTSTSKRTGTIICLEDCVLGTLSRDAYNSSIKDVQTKRRRGHVKFLLSFKIFLGLNWNIFESRFFNFFKYITVSQRETLAIQGEKCDEIYFVKEGEFEVVTKMYESELRKWYNYIKNNKEDHREVKDKSHRTLYKVLFFKNKDVIGLNDMLKDNISMVTITCVSKRGILFSIEKKIFEAIANKIYDVQKNVDAFTLTRRKIMLTRLKNLLSVNVSKDLNSVPVNQATKEEIVRFFSAETPKDNSMHRKKIFVSPSRIELSSPTPPKIHDRNATRNNHPMLSPIQNRKSNFTHYKSISEILLDEDFKRKGRYNSTNTNTNETTARVRSCFKTPSSTMSDRFTPKIITDALKKDKTASEKENKKYLKQILGTFYNRRKRYTSPTDYIDSNDKLIVNSISKSRNNEVFVDPLKFETVNKGAPKQRYNSYYRNVLSPRKLPVNFMDKATPLYIRLNKL